MSTITELLGTGNVGADRTVINDNFNSLNAGKVETEAGKGLSEEDFTAVISTRLASTSGTNTGDQDLSTLALKSNVLELNNTTPFTPTADNQPATKKYVDDNSGGGGIGDMTKAVYDPTSKEADAFSQDSMANGVTNKNYLATEQTKLAGISAGAQVNTINSGDNVSALVNDVGYTTNTGDMEASTYDPNTIAADAFNQDSMVDGTTNKNYLATEQTKLAGIATGAEVNTINSGDNVSVLVNDAGYTTNTGDMEVSTYDPQAVGGDAFSQDSMIDGATNKNYAATEQVKLAGIATGAQVNTIDAGDNVSQLTNDANYVDQAALDLKAPIASPTFTGTVGGVTKAMVDLGNADNTSDLNKPISTLTQTALDLKAPIASPTFTGTVSGVTKAMVGLSDADNTSDANKPVSTAQQTALNLKADISDTLSTSQTTAQSLASDLSLADDKVLALSASGTTAATLIKLSDSLGEVLQMQTSQGSLIQKLRQVGKEFFWQSHSATTILRLSDNGIITGPVAGPATILNGTADAMAILSNGVRISSRSTVAARDHLVLYDASGGIAGRAQTDGAGATTWGTTSDPRTKIELERAADISDEYTDTNFAKALDSVIRYKRKCNESIISLGFDAHDLVDAALESGGGFEGDGPRTAELGSVYDTIKVSDTIPAVAEVVDEETGEVLIEAVAEIPEVWEEKKVTPAGVDQSKLVPLLLLKIDQLDKKDKAKDDLIASLIKRLDDAGIA